MEDLKEKARALPKEPGVYFFKDDKGVVLYISLGKACSMCGRREEDADKQAAESRGETDMIVSEGGDTGYVYRTTKPPASAGGLKTGTGEQERKGAAETSSDNSGGGNIGGAGSRYEPELMVIFGEGG